MYISSIDKYINIYMYKYVYNVYIQRCIHEIYLLYIIIYFKNKKKIGNFFFIGRYLFIFLFIYFYLILLFTLLII